MSSSTALFNSHKKLDAKIVDFHGWLMPIHYKGVVAEHNAVRTKAGLFDVSHMGEFLVFGELVESFLNKIVTNDLRKIRDNQCMYTPMCREDGTIIDDLIVYKHNPTHFMLVVNASNISKDFSWIEDRMKDYLKDDGSKVALEHLSLRNVSDSTSLLALQGPKSEQILSKINTEIKNIRRFHFEEDFMLNDFKVLVSRTGYTGEDGFEIYVNNEYVVELWDKILEVGGEYGVEPIGLGARDTLRLEAALMLYGNDIDDKTTPFNAGLDWTVKLDKENFIGCDSLIKQKTNGLKKILVGFAMVGKGIPREKYKIKFDGKDIGEVTSGTHSPTLQKGIGLGYVPVEYSEVGQKIDIEIRDKPVCATVCAIPFYKK